MKHGRPSGIPACLVRATVFVGVLGTGAIATGCNHCSGPRFDGPPNDFGYLTRPARRELRPQVMLREQRTNLLGRARGNRSGGTV